MDKSKASGKVTMSGRGDAGDVDHFKKGGGGQTTVPFSKATLDLQTQRFLPKEVEC